MDSGKNGTAVVIGAGIAGLSAAWHLQQGGVSVSIFEAGSRLGGRMRSAWAAPNQVWVDLGGETVNPEHADILDLARVFGIPMTSSGSAAKERYFFQGREWGEAEVARGLNLFCARLREDYRSGNTGRFDAISIAEYLDQCGVAQGLREVIAATVRVDYGIEMEEQPLLEMMRDPPEVSGDGSKIRLLSNEIHRFRDGAESLIRAMAERLPPVNLGSPVIEVGDARRGVRIRLEDREVFADAAVIAVPPTALRKMEFETGLSPKIRKFIDRTQLGFNEKLMAGFHESMTAQVISDELLWSWEASAGKGGNGSVRTWYPSGGERSGFHDMRVAALAQQLSKACGQRLSSNGWSTRTGWSDDPFIGGSYSAFGIGEMSHAAPVMASGPENCPRSESGRIFFAGEQFSRNFYAFMNGGAETGRFAAESIHAEIG